MPLIAFDPHVPSQHSPSVGYIVAPRSFTMSLSMSASSASPYPPSAPVGAVDVLATLKSIDSPSSTASYDDVPPLDLRPAYPQAGPPSASPAQEGVAPGPTRRISRLPPPPTIYPGYYATASSSSWTGSAASGAAGPSRQQRYFYVGVRRGHQQGVYTCWSQAEKQIIVSCEVLKPRSKLSL